MPNTPQLFFVASFLSVSVVLFGGHWYIGNKLREAGYDVSRLILIGLPTSDSPRPANGTMSSNLLDIQNNQLTQLVAIALALASGAFFFFKFGRTREFYSCSSREDFDATVRSICASSYSEETRPRS